MIFTLVLCGLALEAFRLSVAAGAIQANLTKRKMIWLGGIFAAVQLFLFLLGTGFLWKWIDFLSISGNMDRMARIGSVIFAILGFVMIFLGIREKRLEESCVYPWSVEGFQTWDDVSMCGLCSGVLSAKNLLVWSGNFSDLVSGFCRWSGLWILAGN